MHIKFVRSGRSGQKAAAYLLRKRVAEEVIVRGGDPVFFAHVVDSLEYRNPYSSAVIAFGPDDQPTEEQIEEVIEGFKRTAWPGLEDDDFCVLIVEHRKKNGKGTHLHFLVANCHLGKKTSFNPAPPGWEKRYGLLRDYLNLRHGWARPDDPKRARKVQPGYRAFPGVAAEKKEVLEWAAAMAEMGLGLEEIAEVARASGAEVPRLGSDYVTLAWGKQRVRVRVGKEEKKNKEVKTIEEQKRKWQMALEKLAEENQKRYGPKREQGEKKDGRAEGRSRTSVTSAGHRVRGVSACSATGEEPDSRPGNMVVLPAPVRMDVGRGPEAGVPRRVQCLGRSAEIPRITQEGSEHGIRIQWVHQASDRTIAATDGGDGTPAKSIGRPGGAHYGGTGGTAPAAGRSKPGMGELWEALEGLLRRLGRAFGNASTAIGRLYEAVYGLGSALGSAVAAAGSFYAAAHRVGRALEHAVRGVERTYEAIHRLAATGGVLRPAMGAEPMVAEQTEQQPKARREVPRADVPRQGWPPGRQGPGWG